MFQLSYRSKSAPRINLKDLNNILDEANTVNSARRISGCLIYHNDSFVQILEGNKSDVLEIFDKIKKDPRHHSVILLSENLVGKRFFEEWNMAFYRPDDVEVELFVNNLLFLSKFSDESTASLSNFWQTVKRILRSGTTRQLQKVE